MKILVCRLLPRYRRRILHHLPGVGALPSCFLWRALVALAQEQVLVYQHLDGPCQKLVQWRIPTWRLSNKNIRSQVRAGFTSWNESEISMLCRCTIYSSSEHWDFPKLNFATLAEQSNYRCSLVMFAQLPYSLELAQQQQQPPPPSPIYLLYCVCTHLAGLYFTCNTCTSTPNMVAVNHKFTSDSLLGTIDQCSTNWSKRVTYNLLDIVCRKAFHLKEFDPQQRQICTNVCMSLKCYIQCPAWGPGCFLAGKSDPIASLNRCWHTENLGAPLSEGGQCFSVKKYDSGW